MNPWIAIALIIWFAAIVAGITTRRFGRQPRLLHLFVFGTGLAVFLSEVPSALLATGTGLPGSLHAVVVSMYYTLQTFTSGADVSALLAQFRGAAGPLSQFEAIAIGLMHLSAPLLLITVIVSYFQTPVSIIRYAWAVRRDAALFTELTGQSIALAESLRAREPRTSIVFANVVVSAGSPSTELIARARAIGAIFFKVNLLSAPLARRSSRTQLRIFVIGNDEVANCWLGLELLESERYGMREATDLYVFSATIEAELALSQRREGLKIRLRRVNPARAMVYDWLWRAPDEHASAGVDIFRSVTAANPVVRAAVIGLGEHGTEMLRALSWYCRMELAGGGRVHLRLDAFDCDPLAEDRLKAVCPGLLPSGNASALHAETRIVAHSGVDATTATLHRLLKGEPLDFVFIALGDDARNIRVAIELFRICVRSGAAPQILAVSRNSAKLGATLEKVVSEATGRVGGAPLPAVHLVGDTEEVYGFDAIVQSEMELNGLVCHLAWADLGGAVFGEAIESFWLSEYNYSASIAVPIHWRAKRVVGVSGAEVDPDERSPEQHLHLQRLEHDRWCSFMLSEGFVPGAYKNAYLIRTHPMLVPFEELSTEERSKDDNDSRATLRRLEADPDWQEAGRTAEFGGLISRIGAAVHLSDQVRRNFD